MEQLAVAIALESIKSPSNITIYSDSAYVVNTYEKNWKRKKHVEAYPCKRKWNTDGSYVL